MNKKKLLMGLLIILVLIVPTTVLADEIQIDGNDVVKINGDVVIQKGQDISGDAVAIVGDVTVYGKVSGDAVAVLGDVRVYGRVDGDVVAIGRVYLEDGASIGGKVTQVGVGGITKEIVNGITTLPNGIRLAPLYRPAIFGFKFFGLITTYALAALTIALFPNNVNIITENVSVNAGRKTLIGFLSLILLPVLVMMTFITIVGIPLVPVILLLFFVVKFLGYVGISLFLGGKISCQAKWSPTVYVELLLGVLALWLVQQIPFIGFLVTIALLIYGVGVALDTRFGTGTSWNGRVG